MTSDANQPGGPSEARTEMTADDPGSERDGGITVPDGTFGPDGEPQWERIRRETGRVDDSHPSVDPDPIIPDPDPRPELPPDIYEGLIPVETFPDGGISGTAAM